MDRIFGIHADALRLRGQRAEVLAANLANADTPGYKARDIDFQEALSGAVQTRRLTTTHGTHMTGASGGAGAADLKYRQVTQPSLDANTVDTQIEQSAFVKNSMRYQATLQFLSGRISGLRLAIKGE